MCKRPNGAWCARRFAPRGLHSTTGYCRGRFRQYPRIGIFPAAANDRVSAGHRDRTRRGYQELFGRMAAERRPQHSKGPQIIQLTPSLIVRASSSV